MRKRFAVAAVALGALTGTAAANPGCEDPQRFCGTFLSAHCLEKLGAGALEAPGDCQGSFADYRGCLELVARGCDSAAPQRGAVAASQVEEDAPKLGPYAVLNVSCEITGGIMTCSGLMKNTAERAGALELYAVASSVDRTSRAFTPTGEELRAHGVGLGDNLVEDCPSFCYTGEKSIPPQVGMRFQVMFPAPDAASDQLALLEIAGEYDAANGKAKEGKVMVRGAPLRRP